MITVIRRLVSLGMSYEKVGLGKGIKGPWCRECPWTSYPISGFTSIPAIYRSSDMVTTTYSPSQPSN